MLSSKQKYKRTKVGKISCLYNDQKHNSKRRGKEPPTYTRLELQSWCFNQELFHALHLKWAESDYDIKFAPSVDRKDDGKSYTLDNIRLTTWKENDEKGHADMRSVKLQHGHKPQKVTLQYTLEGVFIAEYVSANEAARQCGLPLGGITVCCGKNKGTSKGYIWRYKEYS